MNTIIKQILVLIIIIMCTVNADIVGAEDSITTENEMYPSDVLDLEEAKEIALKNSYSVKAAVLRIEQSFERTKQAKSAMYPSVDLQGQIAGTAYDNSTYGDFDNTVYSSDLMVTWNLFNGFKTRYSIQSSEYSEKISKEMEREVKNLLIWMVSGSYFRVQNARESIDIAESDILYNQKLLEDARAREISGAGSYSDVLNFETRINQAKADVISAEYDYKTELTNLASLMGLPGSYFPETMKVSELENTNSDTFKPVDIESEMLTALENRPDILQKLYALEKAGADIKTAKSGYYPSVDIRGTLGSSGLENTFAESDSISGTMMLDFSFNVFSGGSTRAKVNEEKLKESEAEENLNDLKQTLYKELRTVAEEIYSAFEYLRLQEENKILITKTRDIVEKEYKAGKVSLVRLNEVQNDLVSTESSYVMAQVAYLLALEKLEYYTGQAGNQDRVHPEIKKHG